MIVVFGAFTARSPAKKVPGAFWPLLIGLTIAAATTLGLVITLGIFDRRRATWSRSAGW